MGRTDPGEGKGQQIQQRHKATHPGPAALARHSRAADLRGSPRPALREQPQSKVTSHHQSVGAPGLQPSSKYPATHHRAGPTNSSQPAPR
ncbi:hypothetical protein NDU88_005992 [Pleurodeles waltl]|uniref:Uncharacterized protein n=1 Tax=Pleurodeles waltl TaxID=8319 RepID=A0AAV7NPG8_PLEWA|nr:hypothetical protein NDU88_005992 [Pleurodeles waltl]